MRMAALHHRETGDGARAMHRKVTELRELAKWCEGMVCGRRRSVTSHVRYSEAAG
jgi:hypothetical protein